ncbi:MAG: alginate export family protein [Acidobacteriota bacterium]|nr:alginate export family protein [Acidobacteriota bacterium]
MSPSLLKRARSILLLLSILGAIAPGALADETEDPVAGVFAQGKVYLDIRYRYEFVKQDGFDVNANASTARLRFGYETAKYKNFFAYIGFDAVQPVGSERYNSTQNGLTQYPVVADPKLVEVDQLYLGWQGVDNTTTALLGRQAVNLDNQRFVGSVAWRQNQQTLNGLMAKSSYFDKTELFYMYVSNANTVTGVNVNQKTNLLNVSHQYKVGKVVFYGYLLSYDQLKSDSQKSFGLRFNGSLPLGDTVDFLYTGEYANQTPFRDGSDDLDNDYAFAFAGTRFDLGGVEAGVGYEVLGGNGNRGFETPLATLHKFNGWADRFLVTPAGGLRDVYIQASGSIEGVKLVAVYHDFRADFGGLKYGSEIDLEAGKWFKKRYLVALKYAKYMGDAEAPGTLVDDTEKFWVTLRVRI